MRFSYPDQLVQLEGYTEYLTLTVESSFPYRIEGMAGVVKAGRKQIVVVFDLELKSWWSDKIKFPRPLLEVWKEFKAKNEIGYKWEGKQI